MVQYSEIKKNYDDHILLFRMGDFYEVFFDDAVRTSKFLNITLTHRGKIGDFPIPMAGIPHHAAAAYIDRLTGLGLRVAICEQVEDPKEAKGIVKRAVTQVVSPGLPFDLDKAEPTDQKFITSSKLINGIYHLVAIDFTTGEFSGSLHKNKESFLSRLSLYHPKEMITYMGQWDDDQELSDLLTHLGTLKTYLGDDYFNEKFTSLYTEKVIPGYDADKTLKSHQELLSPIGALSYYICSTQQLDSFFHIKPFKLHALEGEMKVTLSTLRGLEIIPRSRETYQDSLLGFMDRTQTALGARALRTLFQNPLFNLDAILERQETLEYLIGNIDKLEHVREALSPIRDLERILAKVSTNKATATDLLNISIAISSYDELKGLLRKNLPHHFSSLKKSSLTKLEELKTVIKATINDEIGASLDKGNLINSGCNKKRDKLSSLRENASGELKELEEAYRHESGIPKLRIKSNNVAGYFIEISKSHSDKVPAEFNRKQTLVNSERYTTPKLSDFEKEMVAAQDKLEKLEREIFKNILSDVAKLASPIHDLAFAIGRIDALQSLAWISFQEDFVKPSFSKTKNLELSGIWHPIIKKSIKDQFVTHDLTLDQKVFFGLITGPNMAGKTTVMREVAIVQLLAQVGCFVPAKAASISLCDFLFSRLGASDDILKGQSTFMVEMAETAEIVRHATDKSLIILDEVGRGTSTYDGLSIAWALVEHLINNTKALGLFATHYHELIDVINGMPEAKNLTVETQNNGDDIKFLYRLIEEGASQSFGIYVAKLAGLPNSLLHRSQEILTSLESGDSKSQSHQSFSNEQLSFFPEVVVPEKNEVPSYLKNLESEIQKLDLNNMTPIESMHKLLNLQEDLKQ